MLRLAKIKHFTVDFKREGNFIDLILHLLDTFYLNEPSFNLLLLDLIALFLEELSLSDEESSYFLIYLISNS